MHCGPPNQNFRRDMAGMAHPAHAAAPPCHVTWRQYETARRDWNDGLMKYRTRRLGHVLPPYLVGM